jgi:RNA-directed DNA polymerase
VNTDAPWPDAKAAEARVLGIQTKLHQWATDEQARRFCDLYNLVCDPAFLLVGWRRVKGNKGARSAGVDGQTASYITAVRGEEAFLAELRADLKARRVAPLPVRERLIPKPGGKQRRLGIATIRDRVVQAALKLVLEPIFEADFHPCSYGFRPGRRAQDAIAELHLLATHGDEWVLEGDITACFDEIDHSALLDRVRHRIADKRVLGLVKAFCKAGILAEDGAERDTIAGTPQGGILSPLLANIALSVLDEHFARRWAASGTPMQRSRRRQRGEATYRLVRYADDFVVMVAGSKTHAEALREQVAAVLAPLGLRLAAAKTRICHIDEGFDFLGFRIRRHPKRGTAKRYVYTYPSKKALVAVKAKLRALTRGTTNQTLAALCAQLNLVLRGWTTYFRHSVAKVTFSYLCNYVWRRVICWLRHKHPRASWKQLRRRYLPDWWPTEGRVRLANPAEVHVTRYRYRGTRIPTPWTSTTQASS